MAEFTDAEVFGTAPAQPSRELSDAEIFGSPTSTSKPAAQPAVLSDRDIGLDEPPGLLDYLGEVGKQVVTGAAEVTATKLRGLGTQFSEIPPDPLAVARRQQELMATGVPMAQATEQALTELRPQQPDPTQNPLYRAGETVSGAVKSALPDRDILHPLVRDVSSGLGSVAGNVLPMMVPGLQTLSVMTTPAIGAGEGAERAVKAGATPDQIQRAANFGNLAGAAEFADVLLPMVGTPGKALGLISRVGLRTLQGAFIEGGTEGLQQFVQNLIARGVYNPKQELREGVEYAALVGAIVGGGVSAAFGGRQGPSTTPTDEEILGSGAGGPPGAPPAAPPPATPAPPTGTSPIESLLVNPVGSAPDPGSIDSLAARTPPEPTVLPTPPTTGQVEAAAMPKEVSEFLNRQTPPLDTTPVQPGEQTSLFTPQKEEIEARPGANVARLAKLLGPKLYGDPSELTTVSVKEMMQNSFDAIKGMLEKGQITEGNIDINMDPRKRTIEVIDDGSGMTPQVLGKQFLEIAGTHKESERASGGLGIAKMLFILGNKNLQVKTLRDGKVSELNTTGADLFTAMGDPTKSPKIQIRNATEADYRDFPQRHGTKVTVEVPQSYEDSDGNMKNIDFKTSDWQHPVLQNSPLFDNINVRLNGTPLPMGTNFPLESYTQFVNVNFPWGSARVYVTKEPSEMKAYGSNLHVLSNGLWQFSKSIKKDPLDLYGENVRHNFYVDVQPKVVAEHADYPFDLNRQEFAKRAKDDFGKIFTYMSLLYRQAGLEEMVDNFGDMEFLDYDPKTGGVTASAKIKIKPKSPPPPTALKLIKPGDKVRVEDGKLIVNGRQVPELKKEDLEKFKIDPDQLRVPQSEIDPRRVILHDNVEVKVSEVETRSIVEYGREKFGKRFDEYVFGIGNAFKELRDVVVREMNKAERVKYRQAFGDSLGRTDTYDSLGKEGIGISFDVEYRGVSIKIPFNGMFINPAVPEFSDPLRAAIGMVGTMVHELAHYKVRSHNADFPAEMQRILIALDISQQFNFQNFKQKVVKIVATYADVFQHLNGVFTSGDFTIQPRGKRFEDSGTIEGRDGGAAQNVANDGRGAERGARLADWARQSQAIPPSEQRRAGPTLQTGPSRNARPTDNGLSSNYNATRGVDPGIVAVPQQPETLVILDAVKKAFDGSVPPPVREAAAHADRINVFYKYWFGLLEMLTSNPNHAPLREYTELARALHLEESKLQDAAVRVGKEWRSLGTQSENLTAYIDDLVNMRYLSADERRRGVARHPTDAERIRLVRDRKVSREALGVYQKIQTLMDGFLTIIEQDALAEAARLISDPVVRAQKMDEIRTRTEQLRGRPFFPFTRFGRHFVTVKDSAGKVILFQTFERRGRRSAQSLQKTEEAKLVAKYGRGAVTVGILPESATSLLGMPSVLLQSMKEKLLLTPEQLNALELMQFEMSPALGFKNFMENKNYTPGYSMDFKRAFAQYMFYGARHHVRAKYKTQLSQKIVDASRLPGNKNALMRDYMRDHLEKTILDARGDYGILKGAIFTWALGYSPAAATQNLTQTPMVTLPFLSGKFGPHSATRALLESIAQLSSYYRRGRYDSMTEFELKALGYGIKTGVISETQAPELAGMSQGGNLVLGIGGNRAQRGAITFLEKAAFMFEMAEQFNRRVVFRAALKLAMRKPNAKYVNASVKRYNAEYRQLVAEFGSEHHARAVITAVNATEQTQIVYSKYARPRLMRGPIAGTLLVFQRFLHGTMTMLSQNKSDVLPGYLIAMLLMGGLSGLPGAEDLMELIKAFAKKFYGKDFNPDRAVREYIKQWFDGTIDPDLVLHGFSQRGFGVPALLDMIGSNPGRGLAAPRHEGPEQTPKGFAQNIPFPVLDRSRAVGMGNILPISPGKLLAPEHPLERTIAEQAQKASGAVFSVGFNIYKALSDKYHEASDPKRWERAVPRALGSASRSFRAFTEGRERGRGGPDSAPTMINYDIRDTEQMLEALALAGGYMPLRLQTKWNSILAKVELEKFYDLQKTALFNQLFEAKKGGNKDEQSAVLNAIRQYNKDLPDWARGKAITSEGLTTSLKNRERSLISRESGVPTQRSNVGISRYIDSLHPNATVDVRRVR